MSPEEARTALAARKGRKRGAPVRYTPEERAALAKARADANNRVTAALRALHQDEVRALYRAALEEIKAERGLS